MGDWTYNILPDTSGEPTPVWQPEDCEDAKDMAEWAAELYARRNGPVKWPITVRMYQDGEPVGDYEVGMELVPSYHAHPVEVTP